MSLVIIAGCAKAPETPETPVADEPDTMTQVSEWSVTAKDAELTELVADTFGDECRIASSCADMLYVDCNSAADGPAYYVKKADGKAVSKCGGIRLDTERGNCPPPEWTCGL